MAFCISYIVKRDLDLRADIECIYRAAISILKDRFLHEFTEHDINHSLRMIDSINKLLLSNKQTKLLNKYEAFVLLSAIYLHDIGLQLSSKSVLQTFAKENSLELPSDNDIDKFIRDNHHLLSAFWIEKNLLSDPVLGQAYFGDKQLGTLVLRVVKSHGVEINDLVEPNEVFSHKGYSIRIKLLCVLICLADVLDCDCRRIDYNRKTYTELAQISRLHWIKHYYVQSVEMQKTLVVIHYRFPALSNDEFVTYKAYFSSLTKYWIEYILKNHIDCLNEAGLTISIHEKFYVDSLKDKLDETDVCFIEECVFDDVEKNNSQAMFAKVAIGILKYKNKVLMVKRRHPEGKLCWQFPAGRLKAVDSVERAVVREVLEETGISTRVKAMLGRRLHPNSKVLCYYVALEYIRGKLKNGDAYENEEVSWVNISEYKTLITSDLYRKIPKYIEE